MVIEIEVVYCGAQTFAGSRIDPPEYCDRVAVRADEDGPWCEIHCAEPDYDGPDEPSDGEPAWWDHAELHHYNEY